MTDALDRRLDRIERRLATLEAVAGCPPELTWPPEPAPPKSSAPFTAVDPRDRPLMTPAPEPDVRVEVRARRTPAAPVPPPAPKQPIDWERFFGLAVLGRVGVGAVLLAAGYFAQLAYKTMSSELKVLAIYLLAAALVGVGFALRAKVARRYVALLWGGGTAAAYLAAVAARMGYELVGPSIALLLLFGASALGQVLARKLRHATLASMALAGAFAAPLFTQSPLDARTFLCVYLLTLHAWSAWVERAWQWRGARAIGVAGTTLMACLWVAREGGQDLSTYLHLHVYLFGLVAPELLDLARGRTVSSACRSLVPPLVSIVEGLLLLASTDSYVGDRAPWVGLLAGTAWLGVAAGLVRRSATVGARDLVHGLAVLGGVLLAVGGITFVGDLPEAITWPDGALQGSALLGITALLLALRKRLGTGEGAATLAALLAVTASLQPLGTAGVFVRWPLGAAACALVLLRGRAPLTRALAAAGGAVAVALGVLHGDVGTASVLWRTWAFAAMAAWGVGVIGLAAAIRERVLAHVGAALAGLAAFVWWAGAGNSPAVTNGAPFLSAVSLSGLTIAALALLTAFLGKGRTVPGRILRGVLWALGGTVVLFVGHREVSGAVQDLLPVARDAWHVVYLTAAGVVLAWIGRGRPRLVARTGLGLVALAGCWMIARNGVPGASAWAAVLYLAPLVGVVGVVLLSRRGSDAPLLMGALISALVFATAWALFALSERFPVDPAFLNLRFGAGLAALAILALLRRLDRASSAPAALATTTVLVGLALGYVVGLVDLQHAMRDLAGTWPGVLASVYTTLFALAALLTGFARKDAPLRYAALVGFGGVIVKVGFHDLAYASLHLRIFVTGILGLVLLGAAFVYARRQDAPPIRRASRSS